MLEEGHGVVESALVRRLAAESEVGAAQEPACPRVVHAGGHGLLERDPRVVPPVLEAVHGDQGVQGGGVPWIAPVGVLDGRARARQVLAALTRCDGQ
jgi:hypothetical protein